MKFRHTSEYAERIQRLNSMSAIELRPEWLRGFNSAGRSTNFTGSSASSYVQVRQLPRRVSYAEWDRFWSVLSNFYPQTRHSS